MRESIRTPEALVQRGVICEADLPAIRKIHQSFAYSVTPYYARLINWLDPNDPLLRMVVPSLNELDTSGSLDVGGEAENTHDEGLQVKYPSTALLLPIPACFSYCRFCFRKRLFNPKVRGDEILKNLDNALDFVRAHPSIDNILLTGGDPLLVNTSHLTKFLGEIRKIKSIKVIRFGTRSLVFLPSRITSDPELVDLLRKTSTPERRVYLVNHFNHPRELTADVSEAADILTKAGVILVNQAVLLRGVNDSPFVLRELFNELAARGITLLHAHCKFIQGSGRLDSPA
jgi:KamA family protein